MRFATFSAAGGIQAWVVSDAGLHSLAEGITVLDLVRAGLPDALTAGQQALSGPAVPLEEARLRPPLDPPTIRDFVAFEEHVEGVGGQRRRRRRRGAGWYQAPTFYFTNPYAVTGPYDDVRSRPVPSCWISSWRSPPSSGRDGTSLTPEQARDHIFGYTILNDWSARDLQRREMKVSLGPAKGKDFATTLGPWLVTADELEPYRDADGFLALDLRVSVNGAEVGQDLLSNMGWPFEDLFPTPPAAPGSAPGTCWARAPAATAAAWPSCGAAAVSRLRRRCAGRRG